MTKPKIPEWVQAAIAKLNEKYDEKRQQFKQQGNRYHDGFADGLKAAETIFMREFERAEPQSAWRPIEDAVFEDRQEVLLTDGDSVWTDTIVIDYEDGEYGFYFDNGSDPDGVTHWQPFPLPPKE